MAISFATKLICFFIIVSFAIPRGAYSQPCKVYWNEYDDSSKWTTQVTCYVDEELGFVYTPGNGAVYQVDLDGFNTCDYTNGKWIGYEGTIVLVGPATLYYISAARCPDFRVVINVISYGQEHHQTQTLLSSSAGSK